MFTGGPLVRRGLRQLGIGAAAAVATYGLSRILGTAITQAGRLLLQRPADPQAGRGHARGGCQGRESARSTERSLRSARPFLTWSPMTSTGTLARAASLVATLPSRTLDTPAPLAPTTSKP
jgi:hypothetical protein